MHLRGESPLLITFEEAPPQHVLLVLGCLKDCSSGGWKLQDKMNQWHHIPSQLCGHFHSLIPEGPSRNCPRQNRGKKTCGGTLLPDKQDGLWRYQASIQTCSLPNEALSCRQSTGGSATHISRGVSLRSPEQHHSHHFAVTHLRGNPQGSCPVLQTKYGCWWLHFSVFCPLIFYCPYLLKLYFSYSIKSYMESNAKLCPNPCGRLVYQVRIA